MGPALVYLPEPNKEKQSIDDESERLVYGACGMQGWRLSMVSSYILQILGGRSSLSPASRRQA